MARVKVLRRFRDLSEHVDREAGSTFAASLARAEEIDARLPGYITYEDEGGSPEEPDLSSLKVAELRAMASERGLTIPKNPTKARLIELLEG